jgi:hypothetical protein
MTWIIKSIHDLALKMLGDSMIGFLRALERTVTVTYRLVFDETKATFNGAPGPPRPNTDDTNGETAFAKEFSWAALGVHGTVLTDGEALDSPRIRAAAGPGNALAYHAAYEFGGDVTALPAGQVWLDMINQTPSEERHLAVHDHHLVGLSTADEATWAAGSWSAIPNITLTGSPAQLTEQLTAIAEQGITEIVYQPTGPDIPHELEAFINVARAVPAGSQVGRPGAGRP